MHQVKERYDEKFFAELHSCIEREERIRNTLGLESRDDINNIVNASFQPKMTFEVGDITEGLHNYPDESFDLIVCKKTLDVVLCGAGESSLLDRIPMNCYTYHRHDSQVRLPMHGL